MALPISPVSSWVSSNARGTAFHSAPGQVSKSFAPPMKYGYIALGCLAFGGPPSGVRTSTGFQSAAMTPSAAGIMAGRRF